MEGLCPSLVPKTRPGRQPAELLVQTVAKALGPGAALAEGGGSSVLRVLLPPTGLGAAAGASLRPAGVSRGCVSPPRRAGGSDDPARGSAARASARLSR